MADQSAVYLDYAAATPMDKRVLDAMLPYMTGDFYNPSALYLRSKQVHSAIDSARAMVARGIGARPSEITFTSGGTESNNFAISGVMHQYPGATMLISAIEHDSVRQMAKQYEHKEIAVDNKGIVSLPKLRSAITDTTVLVSIMYANNEIGTIQPIREIAALIQNVRKQRQQAGNTMPLYLHTDACQATNYLDTQVARLGVDMMSLNGGKIYGPKQTGALYVRAGIVLQAQIVGGGQEHGLRSGTENVPGIVGFAKALQIAHSMRTEEAKRLAALQKYCMSQLSAMKHVRINGSQVHRLPNNISFTVAGSDNERVVMELDERGIMCATGSACSASKDEPSHVLCAIGLTDADARSTIRVTMGRQTTQKDIDRLLGALEEIAP